MGKMTRKQAIEQVRKALMQQMRIGGTLVLYLGRTCPNFQEDWSDAHFLPFDKIFNLREWRQMDVYRRIIRNKEEDHDMIGNPFLMLEGFNLVVL